MRKLKVTPKAAKQLELLEKNDLKTAGRIVGIIRKTCADPLHGNTRKLTNSSNYRARVGQYRIVYSFNQETVEILKIGHRRDVYRK